MGKSIMRDSLPNVPLQQYGMPGAALAVCATTLSAAVAITVLAGFIVAFGTTGFIVGLGASGVLLAALAGMAITLSP